MLIAEDLLLLLTDDASGKFAVHGDTLDLGLAGACLRELADQGRVATAGEGAAVRPGRLLVTDPTPTGDPILDDVLARCAERTGRRPRDVVSKVGRRVRARLLDRLVERGIVERHEGRVLGVFPTTRWPTVDSGHERQVRTRLTDALVQGVTPDPRTAALAGLLSAVGAAHTIVEPADRRAAKRRAKDLRRADWVAVAVADAVAANQAAVSSSVVVAAT